MTDTQHIATIAVFTCALVYLVLQRTFNKPIAEPVSNILPKPEVAEEIMVDHLSFVPPSEPRGKKPERPPLVLETPPAVHDHVINGLHIVAMRILSSKDVKRTQIYSGIPHLDWFHYVAPTAAGFVLRLSEPQGGKHSWTVTSPTTVNSHGEKVGGVPRRLDHETCPVLCAELDAKRVEADEVIKARDNSIHRPGMRHQDELFMDALEAIIPKAELDVAPKAKTWA